MAECPITELDPRSCAHCRKLGDPFAEPTTRRTGAGPLGAAFTARYAGKCACGTDFYPGDAIRADGAGGYLGPCCHSIGDHDEY